MEKAIKVVAAMLVLMLLVTAFLFVWHFTNGFQQSFATFYVSEGKKDVLSESSGNNFSRKYEFEVHYTFEAFMDNPKWSYKLQCIKDFEFFVNDEKHNFSEVDLEQLFNVRKNGNVLTMDCSSGYKALLATYFGVDEEAITVDASNKRVDVVCLTFYSSDGKQSVKISGLFGGLGKVFSVPTGITISPSEVIF